MSQNTSPKKEQLINCPNCHQEVPDTANVCGYCGHRLKVEAIDAQQLQNLQISEPNPEVSISTLRDKPFSNEQQRLTWFFVLLWVGSYVIGYAPRRFLASLIGDIVGLNFYNLQYDWQSVMEYLVAGFVVGLLQWLILRKKVGVSIAWIALTGVGLLIGESLRFITPYNSFLYVAISGAIFSLGQWFLLRKLIPKGYWWIVINAAALLIAQTFWFINTFNSFFGVMTGIGLLWLLRSTLERPFSKSRKI